MSRLTFKDLKALATVVSMYYRRNNPEWEPWTDGNGAEYNDGNPIMVQRIYNGYAVCFISSGTTGHINLTLGSIRECYAYLEAMRAHYYNLW